MAGLLYLQHAFRLSDEAVVARWVENPYYQHLTGETFFQHRAPIDPKVLEEFTKEYDTMSSKTLHRYLDGTQQHAKRRQVEMADVVEMLSDADYDSTMTRGVEITLSQVVHGKKIPFAELD